MTADSLHHRRPVRAALVLLILIAGYPSAILAVPNSECMDCHEAEFKSRKKDQPKEWVGVRPEVFAASVHGKLDCVGCHDTIKETPHVSKLPKVDCASCHEKTAAKHSFHSRLAQSPVPAGEDTS